MPDPKQIAGTFQASYNGITVAFDGDLTLIPSGLKNEEKASNNSGMIGWSATQEAGSCAGKAFVRSAKERNDLMAIENANFTLTCPDGSLFTMANAKYMGTREYTTEGGTMDFVVKSPNASFA